MRDNDKRGDCVDDAIRAARCHVSKWLLSFSRWSNIDFCREERATCTHPPDASFIECHDESVESTELCHRLFVTTSARNGTEGGGSEL